MTRLVYILMITAVAASFCLDAAGETMDERKQRIMRKYLRERQDIIQSDIALPVAGAEDLQVLDSEKFRQKNVDLSREQGVTPPAPIVQPIPVQVRKNWMFPDDASEFDPNADPFAMDTGEDLQDDRRDWLTEWRERQQERATQRVTEPATTYDYTSGRSTYSSSDSRYGYSGQQDRPAGYSSYGATTRPGGNYGYRSYGESPSGMLKLPDTPVSPYNTQRSSTPGYTPYGSSYETRQEQRRLQRVQPPKQEEFSRPTPYQQWKSDNKDWDPTADDTYLDDLMRRNRN